MDDHDHSEVRALRCIGGNLLARGLEVTETMSADGLVELAITNPAEPGKGRIYVGNEGYMIWEYWARADTGAASAEIISTVTATLGGPSQ
jgi:hypothetical protein